MNEQLKHPILAQYPEWHRNPIRLTISEMQDPHIVLNDFFNAYHLTDIRTCLREWLGSVIRTDEIPALDYIHLHDSIERLIEAAWLLHSSKKYSKQKKKKK